MKESNGIVQKKQACLDANRNGRLGSCVWSTTRHKANADGTHTQDRADTSAQRINRRPGEGTPRVLGRRTSADFQPAAKLTQSAHTLSRPRDIVVLREPRRSSATAVAHGILLPPIGGSASVPRKEDNAAVVVSPSMPQNLARLSNSVVMRDRTVFRVLVARHKKTQEMSGQSKGGSAVLGVSFRVLNKDPVSGSCSGTAAGDSDCAKSPLAAPSPALMELKIGPQKSDVCTTGDVETNTGNLKAEPQRALCWDDSDVETESQCSEGNVTWRTSHWLEESDEYYTCQRIVEWVVKVNSTLFNTSKENCESVSPVEEQDISTIKIKYDGD